MEGVVSECSVIKIHFGMPAHTVRVIPLVYITLLQWFVVRILYVLLIPVKEVRLSVNVGWYESQHRSNEYDDVLPFMKISELIINFNN